MILIEIQFGDKNGGMHIIIYFCRYSTCSSLQFCAAVKFWIRKLHCDATGPSRAYLPSIRRNVRVDSSKQPLHFLLETLLTLLDDIIGIPVTFTSFIFP